MRFTIIYSWKICILFFFSYSLFAQNFNTAIHFESDTICGGGSGSDSGFHMELLQDGYLVFGVGWAPEFCGWQAMKVWKTDFEGNVLWQKIYGQEGHAYYLGLMGNVVKTQDHHFAFVGSIYKEEDDDDDVVLFKFDEHGDTLWTKSFGGNQRDLGYAVIELANGDFIMTGATRSLGGASEDNPKIYMARTDSEGNLLWQKGMGGTHSWGESIHQTPDGGFRIGAVRQNVNYDTYFVKTDSLGNIETTTTWANPDPLIYDCSARLRPLADGSGYLLHSCIDTFEVVGGFDWPTRYIAKIDHDLNMEWRTFVGSDQMTTLFNARELNDGSFAVVGSEVSPPYATIWGYIAKFSVDGTPLWKRYLIHTVVTYNYFYDFQELQDGGFILTGTTNNGTQDMWLVKLNADGCLSDTVCDSLSYPVAVIDPDELPQFLVYPNPASSVLQVTFSGNVGFLQQPRIVVRDIQGKIVYEQSLNTYREEVIQIDVSRFKKGIYILSWMDGGQLYAQEKVAVMH